MVPAGAIENVDQLVKDYHPAADIVPIKFAPHIKQVVVLAGHHRHVAAERGFAVISQLVQEGARKMERLVKTLSGWETEAEMREACAATGDNVEDYIQAQREKMAQIEQELDDRTVQQENYIINLQKIQLWPAEVYSAGK
jgi:hypothetical protein